MACHVTCNCDIFKPSLNPIFNGVRPPPKQIPLQFHTTSTNLKTATGRFGNMYRFRAFLKTQKPLLPLPSVPSRASTTIPQKQCSNLDTKPLSVLFEEAIGLRGKTDTIDKEIGDQGEGAYSELGELLRDIRDLKAENGKPDNQRRAEEPKRGHGPKNVKNLSSLFLAEKQMPEAVKVTKNETSKPEEPTALKELSPQAKSFVRHLYAEGYFNGANFLRGNKLDLGCFDTVYSRTFTVNVSEKFGKDHQDIAKWLSGSKLKNVALFGCPSDAKKNSFAAKRVRKFFDIQENSVCDKCLLKDSCKYANKAASSWRKDLVLADVMMITLPHILGLADPRLKVTDEVIESVHHLVKEIIKLSKESSKSLC